MVKCGVISRSGVGYTKYIKLCIKFNIFPRVSHKERERERDHLPLLDILVTPSDDVESLYKYFSFNIYEVFLRRVHYLSHMQYLFVSLLHNSIIDIVFPSSLVEPNWEELSTNIQGVVFSIRLYLGNFCENTT